jgi:cellulose synthase/poly-beta-1,6-N-acetylglucosamine synthase-like glycosyltransferase
VRTPRNLLANLQIIEYLRAFLGGRIGWSKSGMLLIISGAFGLFRRDVCVDVGGYDPTTVGEDVELVLRLHRHQRERQLPCRITFFPDPICWTECPEDLGTLVRQRDRWQRGLIEMIARHRKMLVILMEERAFRRCPGWSDLIRVTLCAVVENVGYRQLLAVVRMRAWYTLARRQQHWGEMTRKGFGPLLPGGVLPSER